MYLQLLEWTITLKYEEIKWLIERFSLEKYAFHIFWINYIDFFLVLVWYLFAPITHVFVYNIIPEQS